MDNDTFVKLFRSFISWEWYTDQNTKDVFIHCLLMANWKDKKWKGTVIPRGSFITSISRLSSDLNLSEKKIRTAINHLKQSNDITVKTTNQYSLITVVKYGVYQINANKKANDFTDTEADKGQSKGNQRAIKGQQLKKDITIEDKRYKIKDKSTCVPELKIHYLTERLLNKKFITENETEIFDEIIREYLAEYDAVDVSVKGDYVLGLMKDKQIDNRMAYFKSAMNKNLKHSYLPEERDSEELDLDGIGDADMNELDDFLKEFE
ncbi:hypothetical protein [Thomasclavelia cocleata]|uniref:hypothetical protein n=1 Tax=Thomasclavelia cocleata TaxID=69824 RepID=UPI00272D2577|nr:hypothetical protein [Thomasclavelia cocleata]